MVRQADLSTPGLAHCCTIFLCHWDGKYSTGWQPPIGGGRSETELQGPKYTKSDLVFCKMSMPWWFGRKTFFLASFSLFLGVRETFFRGVLRFSKIVVHFPKLWFNRGPGGNHHPTQQGIRKFIMKHRYSFLLAFDEYLERRVG